MEDSLAGNDSSDASSTISRSLHEEAALLLAQLESGFFRGLGKRSAVFRKESPIGTAAHHAEKRRRHGEFAEHFRQRARSVAVASQW